MAKRIPDPALAGQMDMFGDAFECVTPVKTSRVSGEIPKALPQLKPANDILDVSEVANDAYPDEVTDEDVALAESASVAAHQAVNGIEQFDAKSLDAYSRPSPTWLNDEWWTTAMVCDYLKLGRKAIWERQRDHRFQFPSSFHFGTTRHRWRSEDVKAWAKVGHQSLNV